MDDDIVHATRNCGITCLDGVSLVEEYAKRSKQINQKFLCITDHGVMGAVPYQIAQSEEYNLHPIFGIEMYVNSMQPKTESRNESAEYRKSLPEHLQKIFSKSNHLLGIAYNEEGYKNLVRLSSWAWIHGFYKKPRINHEILEQYKAGIIFTSTCANSEIANALFDFGEDAAFAMVEKYMAMFGENFYLELMMLDYVKQKPYNTFLIKCHLKYGIPITISQDCHYCTKEQSRYQQLMLTGKNGKTIQEIELLKNSGEDVFELQDTQLWMKSEDELNDFWEEKYQDNIDYDIFKSAKETSVKICERAKGVKLDRKIKLPSIDSEELILKQKALQGFEDRSIPTSRLYLDRFEEEYDLICKKGFCSYFLIQKMMVEAAQEKCKELYGWTDVSDARGPGRGSVGGSLLAYALDLHDVDPIEHDLLFSRFLSPARGGLSMKIRFSQEPIS